MRVLFDTCVIVDVLQNRVPFSEAAQALFLATANNHIESYITAKSLTDLYYLTHRQTHSNQETRKILGKLLSLFCLLDTAASDCHDALASTISDYEDAVMVSTAVRTGMDCIVTRNIKDYRNAQITIYTPENLMEELKDIRGACD